MIRVEYMIINPGPQYSLHGSDNPYSPAIVVLSCKFQTIEDEIKGSVQSDAKTSLVYNPVLMAEEWGLVVGEGGTLGSFAGVSRLLPPTPAHGTAQFSKYCSPCINFCKQHPCFSPQCRHGSKQRPACSVSRQLRLFGIHCICRRFILSVHLTNDIEQQAHQLKLEL